MADLPETSCLLFVEDKVVVDLFCGSGSLGIEALSRNAKEVYFVDKDKNVIKIDYNSGKIFSANKNINTSLKKNNTYNIRFYDVLKSSRLSDHEDYINNTNW